jgi:hypothetical protein
VALQKAFHDWEGEKPIKVERKKEGKKEREREREKERKKERKRVRERKRDRKGLRPIFFASVFDKKRLLTRLAVL